jgi:hypothetical protein
MVIDTLEAMQEVMFDPVVDLSKARVENFTSILERESFFKRLKGTMGKNLDTTAYRK